MLKCTHREQSLKYGLLLAAALAAPASAADPGLTEAIAFHCGWQFGTFLMRSTDITKEELPKCKEIRLRADLMDKTHEELHNDLPEACAFTCGVNVGMNSTRALPNTDDCERIYHHASNVTIPSGAFAP
jgi:hypothetical protein